MKIGVFYGRKYYRRNFAGVLGELARRGNELVLAMPDRKPKPYGLPRTVAQSPLVSTALFPFTRDDGLDEAIRLVRAVRDAARYERSPLRAAFANRQRAYRKLGQVLGMEVRPPSFEIGEDELHVVDTVLEALATFIPPSAPLVRFIEESAFDVVLVLSRINFGSKDLGVVDAARAAGVPSGIAVYSWDNLSSKALIHEHPDRLFVWNDVMAHEAVELHGLDPRMVEATGAPRFDSFFELEPSAPREELLAGWGLDPARRCVLYLGSSGFVSKREPELIDRWISAVRTAAEVNVLVRPHPGTLDEPGWQGWRPHDERTAMPKPRRKEQDLFDQLSAADAVVALNTSAELEAAIVGRPVLTMTVGDLAPGQEGSTHFPYLLVDNGGFVEQAGTLEQHVEQLTRALEADPHSRARTHFVERFLRPRGIDRPAAVELAHAIERLRLPAGRDLGCG
jgi:hypothetical protein